MKKLYWIVGAIVYLPFLVIIRLLEFLEKATDTFIGSEPKHD